MKSVMTHNFSQAPSIDAPRSQFDLSHGNKTTFNAGELIPVFHTEVVPGDSFNLKMTAFARLATPLFPIMDNMFMDSHFFFVPYRLIWDNSKKFFGEQTDPGDSIDFTMPVLSGNTFDADPEGPTDISRIMDYMGIPTGIDPDDIDINALPYRAYYLCFDEWFRDQNLQDSVSYSKDDGPDPQSTRTYTILKRGKRHDYFTSALPWPQKGDAVSLPLGTTAPIESTGGNIYLTSKGNPVGTVTLKGDTTTTAKYSAAPDSVGSANMTFSTSSTVPLEADLSGATSSTINDLREAFQVQKLLERDARGGTRYSELVKNHFGVNFYDVSYRPEYLGGGSSPVNINPIASQAETTTSGTSDGTGVGQLGAMGTVQASGHGFTKSFVEHGLIIGLVSVRADLTYQQGLHRFFRKKTRYDIYWPSLAHLGEQEITNAEIYTQGTTADDDVFGYQERYAEYRYLPSRVSGLFRSAASASLDAWHLSQEFSSLPTLGDTFIKETPPMDRIKQVTTEPDFIFDSYFQIKAARPMPVFGVPGLIDHF
jgi:hypothetical protein